MTTIAPITGQADQGKLKEKLVKNTKNLQRAALGNISNANALKQEKIKNNKLSVKELKSVDIEEVIEVIEDIEVDEEVVSEDNEFEQVNNKLNIMRIQSRGVGIFNIDKDDMESPQLMAEYVKDIYEYLRSLEGSFAVRPGVFAQNSEITGRMRAILVDWLVSVHQRFHLLQETLFLAVNILDRYLQDNQIQRQHLQLVGVSALWIAAKYEEMYSPELVDFVYITDNAYTKSELRQMECIILRALDFQLGGPLPIHFLRRFSKAGQVSGDIHTVAKYFIELALMEHSMVHYQPSKLSAAALLMSMRIQENLPWTPALEFYSRYSEADLKEVLCKLAVLITNPCPNKLSAIRNKYATSKYFRISRSERLTTSPYVLHLLESN